MKENQIKMIVDRGRVAMEEALISYIRQSIHSKKSSFIEALEDGAGAYTFINGFLLDLTAIMTANLTDAEGDQNDE